MAAGLFDGLKVIDCASYIAAPASATVLSDFGADVIKIEPPGVGDPYRTRAQLPPGHNHPTSPFWLLDNRNKRSLALNLATEQGQSVLRRLVASADIFITNFPGPVRRKMRITYDDLAPLNGRLIYGSFTGYGESGPEAEKPGFDATAWWARSGLMHLTRAGDDAAPARSLPGMGDHPSAMAMYAALVTALYQRERTGKGMQCGSSLLMNGLWANGCHVQSTLCGETVLVQPERTASPGATRNIYRCADGRWLQLLVLDDDRRWPLLKQALGSGLLDDPRFATTAERVTNARELTTAMDTVFASRPLAEWRAILDKSGLVFGIIAEMEDIPHDEQMRASGALVPFENDDLLTVTSPFWVGGQEKVAPRHAATVGEHSEAVLREAGYAADEIAAMREARIVG